jgi:RND superfamily putative drug exporter
VRHPRLTLLTAGLCLLVFGGIGLGVEEELAPSDLSVSGTDSARADQLLREHFGDSAPFAVLLEGPPAQLDRQGPRLVRRLRAEPGVTTLSPWDRGPGVGEMRPSRGEALIIADFHVPAKQAVTETVPLMEGIVAGATEPPVEATATGYAVISKALQDRSIDATRRAELIATPILLIVLLLVFRSPVAALIPLLFGGATVLISRGLISLLTGAIDFDAFALAVTSMMGLALGVDYALLMVSRFREELAAGEEVSNAASLCRQTAGRTTVFAGSTLFLATTICALTLPGSLLVSLAAAVAVVTATAVTISWLVAPAALVVVGRRIDLWRLHAQPAANPARAARAALRRPRTVAAVIAAALLVLAAPAASIETGPPSTDELPVDDPARADADLIASRAGPGWAAPFIIVTEVEGGAITEGKRLHALARSEREIASMSGVDAVIGPGPLAKRTRPLRRFGKDFIGPDGQPKSLAKADSAAENLGRASDGVGELRSGLLEASRGAGALGEGAGRAEGGARQLSAGLQQAVAAGGEAGGALGRLRSGTSRLSDGQQQALVASQSLTTSLRDFSRDLAAVAKPTSEQLPGMIEAELGRAQGLAGPAQTAEAKLAEALSLIEGMTVGTGDPLYAQARQAVSDAQAALGATGSPQSGQLQQIAAGLEGARFQSFVLRDWIAGAGPTVDAAASDAQELSDGTARLRDGTQQLESGASLFAGQAEQLSDGLNRLAAGAALLPAGLSELAAGNRALASGLGKGYVEAHPLQEGLRKAKTKIRSSAKESALPSGSPRLFDSDYFVLAGLDGTRKADRARIAQGIDLEGGGDAAAIHVIPSSEIGTEDSSELRSRLRERADALGAAVGGTSAVAGGAAQVDDHDRVTSARLPLLVVVISLLTFCALVVILRAVPLAAIAVGLNLVTVAAAFGVLALLFEVPEGWPLGGHSYVDTVAAAGIFGVVFGLSIDYAVFLLTRMREGFEDSGEGDTAISYGLERTAGVITGAAAIMAAVFIAFAGAPIATVSQLGVGLTVAVLLDATIIRIVLLPVIMHLIGPRVWWMPPALGRRLPRLTVEGTAIPEEAAAEPLATAEGPA